MKSKKILSIIFLVILLFPAMLNFAFAQKKNHTITDKYLTKSSQTTLNTSIVFKNINVQEYYRHDKELKKIDKAEKAGDKQLLLPLLESYVSNFGIANFGLDADLLWKLGQLYEESGQLERAKYVYRIILKNTEYNLEYVLPYYNKLTVNHQDQYVPIDYYYELVEYRKQVDTLRPPRGVFINMGNEVNSEFEDYGPSLNSTNDVLLFTSKRNRSQDRGKEVFNEDIFWALRVSEDEWMAAEPFEGVNTRYNEGSPCLTKDGKTLYFIRCEAPDGFGNCDIYTAELISDGNWGHVKNLGPNINSPEWDSHPCLSHTEDTLYFVSGRQGGFGSTDIYYTVKDNAGKWQPAKNLGPVINTKGTEASPFLHPKHNVLYFSSNGQLLNFGNFDIYKSYLEEGNWSEPKNIGPLVNGIGEEFYFTIDSDSKDLFYARSEEEDFKGLDLYSFPLPMEAQPMATTVFKGSLKDSVSGIPFEGIVSIIDLDNGIEVAPKYIRSDGSFDFALIDNKKYLLIIQGDAFFRIEKIFQLDGDTVMNFKTPSINFVKIKFQSVEFATSSAEILPHMMQDLDKLMDFMLDNPTVTLKISGHTDSQGNKNANFNLSQNRADSIKKYLVGKGDIDPTRISAKGFGSNQPIIKDEKTEDDRKLNRRVEFEIIRPGNDGAIDAWGRRK